MIDLHTHTTASDGRCTPGELVARAASAGVTVLSITDHDTVAAYPAAMPAATAAGIELVPGIEVTAVADDKDVHVLGYFIDVSSPGLLAFLAEQRRRRVDRIRQIVDKLGAHGIVLDAEAIIQPGLDDSSRAVGRPWVARALVAGGFVATIGQAFEQWLGHDRPAFVPRLAATPVEVVAQIHEAGGVASLAHPGLVKRDEWLPGFAAGGLDALEAYHSDHDAPTTSHYLAMAARLGLAVTGGSDYHADESHGSGGPGHVSLPADAFVRLQRLQARA